MVRFWPAVVFAAAAAAQPNAGLWDATVNVNGNTIPFRFEIAGTDAHLSGNFFNGEERVPSSGGELREGKLLLDFASYANRLEATVTPGRLDGRYGRDGRWYEFHAVPAAPARESAVAVP